MSAIAPYGSADAAAAADAVRDRLGVHAPVVAIVLGSGLGGLVARLGDVRRVPYSQVPGFPEPRVVGHAGELLAGTLASREIVALAGRFHYYEGHGERLAAFPVRVVHALGARRLFLSNAAGGIRRTFAPGTLMVIGDHINLAWRNPLTGGVGPGEDRFPDMSDAWDGELRALLHRAARDAGVHVEDGVYAWLTGPTYETPAEVRMLERLGADATGMSTVPEALAARALGMRVGGMSCITNMAAGITGQRIHHEEVLEVTAAAARRFEDVVERWVALLPG